jgi:high affinity Mn2+ porin
VQPPKAIAGSGDGDPTLPVATNAESWNGFYIGGHLGYAEGRSDWTVSGLSGSAPTVSGSFGLYHPFDAFTEAGSFFEGLQVGYNRTLPGSIVVGIEAETSYPSWPNRQGISIGGISHFNSASLGPATYSENVIDFGTLRGRIGYSSSSWLFYATGGLAWTHDQLSLTRLADGMVQSPYLWRLGWAAGAGVEFPVATGWTGKVEYLLTDYAMKSHLFAVLSQQVDSDFLQQEVRVGINYQLGGDSESRDQSPATVRALDPNRIVFHEQATFVEQVQPAFRSPYSGLNSLQPATEGRETSDVSLYAGLRLWQGAEFWFNPELEQGFGLSDTHGIAGFASGEAFKLGADYPYARIQRAFLRQTIALGGESEKVDADLTQFAGWQTKDRLVLTLGRFAVTDIFDTNKYANSARTDFVNWSMNNAVTFDFGSDAWEYTMGAAVEWYQGPWTLRAGLVDLSATPEGGISPAAYGLDQTFKQFTLIGEIEERHELAGQPGKIKVTTFLDRGRAGDYGDAIALAQATGQPADITAVRHYRSRPGVSINLEQQVTSSLGLFARAGWADGRIEPWDFTDADRTLSAGLSIKGTSWGRPNDTIGLGAAANDISGAHVAFLDAGGLGILVGDGQLPHPGLEKIVETYYSYAWNAATRISADFQFIDNPGYNTDRGPVSVFSLRVHLQN